MAFVKWFCAKSSGLWNPGETDVFPVVPFNLIFTTLQKNQLLKTVGWHGGITSLQLAPVLWGNYKSFIGNKTVSFQLQSFQETTRVQIQMPAIRGQTAYPLLGLKEKCYSSVRLFQAGYLEWLNTVRWNLKGRWRCKAI